MKDIMIKKINNLIDMRMLKTAEVVEAYMIKHSIYHILLIGLGIGILFNAMLIIVSIEIPVFILCASGTYVLMCKAVMDKHRCHDDSY